MLAALLADALMGWPRWLFAAIGHPVTWLGRMIGMLDTHLNSP
ncbi:MAG TPA: cobalamin biosynthesis protein, partial [Hyphomicrobiaceae bacterium]|nr:cobalamin biosynthesis protein [Hyphomicrobiaceae bacterium]